MTEHTTQTELPLIHSDAEKEVAESHNLKQVTKPEYNAKFGKYIVYVDESGDHSLQSIDPQYPIFVLAFCVFHKHHYSNVVVPLLEKFKFKYFGHDQVVLHENEIRRRKGMFRMLNTREYQQQFMNELTQVIEESNFILISATIDKNALKKEQKGENAYHIALALCIEALYEFLEEKNEHQQKTHVVVECRGNKEDKDLELEFRRICADVEQQKGNLPLDILFSDKKVMSSGLQLADLVARPIGLQTLKPGQENRAFKVLTKKFYCEGGRKHLGEKYENVGMKVFP